MTSIWPSVCARPFAVCSPRSRPERTKFFARCSSASAIGWSATRASSAQSADSARAGSTPGFSFSEIWKSPGSMRQPKYTFASTHSSCS